MGVFKKFIGGLALESMQTSTDYINENTTVIPFKDTSGTTRTSIYLYYINFDPAEYKNACKNGYAPYFKLTAVATDDDVSEYSINDYSITGAVGTTTQTVSRNIANNSASNLYNVTITAVNEITVKCIKFHKPLYSSGGIRDVLICAYYLDAPLTIPAGESRTITIEMKVGTDVSVNES